MRKLLIGVALGLAALATTTAMSSGPASAAAPAPARVGIVCNKFVGEGDNTWVQWSKCGGLEQNNYMQRVRGKFCTWFDHDCFVFSGPFVHVNWGWSKLEVNGAKYEREGTWTQLCPETGCL